MMKKRMTALLAALGLTLIFAGCGTEPAAPQGEERPWAETVEYSNLADRDSREQLDGLMDRAGISPERRQVFFDHVDQFNGAVAPEMLTDGFETVGIALPRYDPYEMQDMWMAAYPDFLGYNCRITAFGLFADRMEIPEDAEVRDDTVMMDLAALELDPAAVPTREEQRNFSALYSDIPTQATKDIGVHLEKVQQDWAERGISFPENDAASLITVFFHDDLDPEQEKLFVGHVGVLFQAAEDELYLVEKIAFQEPYQMDRFSSRGELSDYLMTKYDVSYGQPTASPFVMENDQLIEGYRTRPVREAEEHPLLPDADAESGGAVPQLNRLVFMNGADFTDMEPVVTENHGDGTYRYEDATADGLTRIVNAALPGLETSAADPEEYITRFLNHTLGQGEEFRITESEDHSVSAGMPAYLVEWTLPEREKVGRGLVVLSDSCTYCYCFLTSPDNMAEMADVYGEILDRLELKILDS